MVEATERICGVLMHPTSLPNCSDAIGTIGKEAYTFIDWLVKNNQKMWQVLPLNPTGYGDSPYASFSAFAGNPFLIDLLDLNKQGDLTDEELATYNPPEHSFDRTDFGWIYENKMPLLYKASRNFKNKKAKDRRKQNFEKFKKENSDWLEDYAVFMALKASQKGTRWDYWPEELCSYQSRYNLQDWINDEDIEFIEYTQWIFYAQWASLRKYANSKGITIMGDAPIFVAYDSSDVWAHQDLYFLDGNGKPTVVAGVPPDYFSETGQLWGNPLYRWEKMKEDGYNWWMKRIKNLLKVTGIIRIDHFRGLSQYWEVQADEETAMNGKWVDGPGDDFFVQIKKNFKAGIPIVAEDLGLITPDVEKMRDDFDLPGMKIFEFAPWGETHFEKEGASFEFKVHRYLPKNYELNCVGYLGTHDNDTFIGWYRSLEDKQRNHLNEYLQVDNESDAVCASIKRLLDSDANTVIFSLQDLLGLDAGARMNTPGTCGAHNWSWRLSSFEDLNDAGIIPSLPKLVKEGRR